jgi:anti-sigma-K factor RskA
MNERIDELIALAALGELTPAEAAELDAAVAADPRLAAELADALTSAAMLQASAVEEPPARLRASVLDAIAGLPQDGAAPSPAVDDDRATDDGTSSVRRIDAPRKRRWFAPLAAAAAVLALVAGGVIISTNDEADDPIAAVVDAPDARSQTVSGSLGELQFVYSADEGAAVLIGESIDPAPEDATYQLWLVSDGVATSIGTFDPDSEGAAAVRVDGVDPTGSTIGVTVEPVGGSDEPTLPLVAQSA